MGKIRDVKMTNIGDDRLKFEFACDRDRGQILDLAPWALP